jgi:hypothetical protein
MEQILSSPEEIRSRYDPWWNYDVSHVRNAGDLVKAMRQALGGLPR